MNIERQTSNGQPALPEEYRTAVSGLRFCVKAFCCAVLMLDMKMRINSSDSFKTNNNVVSFFAQLLR